MNEQTSHKLKMLTYSVRAKLSVRDDDDDEYDDNVLKKT